VRLLLVLVLVHGLVPDLAEIAETAVHYASTGHGAHTAADMGDLGDQGREHGCGTTQHRCACCVAQAVVVPAPAASVALEGGSREPLVSAGVVLAAGEPARPFRPPIS
jgi:hypothetical protein